MEISGLLRGAILHNEGSADVLNRPARREAVHCRCLKIMGKSTQLFIRSCQSGKPAASSLIVPTRPRAGDRVSSGGAPRVDSKATSLVAFFFRRPPAGRILVIEIAKLLPGAVLRDKSGADVLD